MTVRSLYANGWDPERIPPRRAMDDIAKLGILQAGSGDTLGLDPDHFILRWRYERMGLDEEERLWYTLLYMASRRPTTAHLNFRDMRTPAHVHDAPDACFDYQQYPSSFERRNLRTVPMMRKHINALYETWVAYGRSWKNWMLDGFTGDPRKDWMITLDKTSKIWGNGRWSAFNTAEILMNSNDAPIACSYLGYDGCTGPRMCLEMVFPSVTRQNFEQLAVNVMHWLDAHYGLQIPINEVETLLCEYHSMARGLHCVGHFPDEFQEQLLRAEQRSLADKQALKLLWESRLACMPHRYLGEVMGWVGVDRGRLHHYKFTGEILDR